MIDNKKILIFGGAGSLGYELNRHYLDHNIVYNFSRDEHKHWLMKLKFNNHQNLQFIIGNILDRDRVRATLLRINPDIVIIASAMKHIDQCEINTGESINTNLIGTQNILNSVEEYCTQLNLQTLIFVSSDKACNPINNYGMCKALSETLVIEKAYYIPTIKFINVRYGNVLNSSGSIIPRLHTIGKSTTYDHFSITHPNMTRFVMTLEQAVNLIEHAIINGLSGETIISELTAMKIVDLIDLFSNKYNKPIKITGMRSGEKLSECLMNFTQSAKSYKIEKYTHIRSVLTYDKKIECEDMCEYNSDTNLLTSNELKKYLIELELL